MIEFFKHMFGFCGEHWHPNIFTIIMGVPAISYLVFKIKHRK
jgi:hypothetical protein